MADWVHQDLQPDLTLLLDAPPEIAMDRAEKRGEADRLDSEEVDFLSSIIEAKGISVLRTREPGGTPMAERIRQMVLAHDEEPLPDIAELLLFFAARALHVNNTIQPALAAGTWVVCDRFTDASRAYQGHGRGMGLER